MSDPVILDRVTLNFTDLTGAKTGCVKKGSNKFWIGWVQKNADGTVDYCCQWGSVGTSGSTNGSKANIGEASARKMLDSKAASKRKKGYTELDTRSKDEEIAKAAAQGIDLTTGKAVTPTAAPAIVSGRKFHKDVVDLLGIIYNSTARAVSSGLSSQAGATEDNPIGNLSDAQLDKGGSILDEIGRLIEAKFGHETPTNQAQTLPLASSGMPSPAILDLTNDYYSNVPRPIGMDQRGRNNLHRLVVSSYERLQREREFMQLLRDAHMAKATFAAAAAQSRTTGGKETVWYDGLGCEIEALSPSDAGFKRAKEVFDNGQSRKNANWFSGGRSRCHVVRVWKFSRNGSTDRFDRYSADIKKRRGSLGNILAWHGTRTANLLGIGKSGLLMPENLPKGVHISGKAFGRGIYHAPVTTNLPEIQGVKTDGTNGALKSMNYTGHSAAYYGGSSNQNVFMFLQELALGVGEIRTTPCWDKRRPDGFPQKDFIYAAAGGCSTLSHDEAVTFDQDAQVFRYLLEIGVR